MKTTIAIWTIAAVLSALVTFGMEKQQENTKQDIIRILAIEKSNLVAKQ